MNNKKLVAVAVAVILVSSLLLFLFGYTGYLHFLAVAIVAAIFAYKILPKMK